MHNFQTVTQWLDYLESIHATEIDMGLARISKVAKRIGIDLSASQVITVAGTNGKGTTCAFIENALLAEGKSVAVYSSPHINVFNERLRINQELVQDPPLIAAFETIEQARKEISLTYYEYTTLAALIIIQAVKPDVVILEVGLGGRLDATNIIDSDIAVITSIDLDHQAFLGNDRTSIGLEKAGIIRANKPVVIGEPNLPEKVLQHCQEFGALVCLRERDFSIREDTNSQWCWRYGAVALSALTHPFIPRDNVATALAVLAHTGIELSAHKVNQWIVKTQVEGRTEVIKQSPLVVLDVGHNPHAARYLNDFVKRQNKAKVLAVCGMLVDKDIKSVLREMLDCIDHWYVGSLPTPRGASSTVMAQTLADLGKSCNHFDNISEAYKIALEHANNNDMILVFGSFFTVAEVKKSQ
ncbi:bifunctional tetrahydrofolate synthase/dihydrofolate synthase [Thalassotalea aquiviva]|uniref:bifunctional tetrahydrofolate synthase/dihydrofolate synthase n=1 Tax=Thalassotalea aquiviva TaxID=3242415 RepID=UPI00352AAB72